jgi:hypothetical protein
MWVYRKINYIPPKTGAQRDRYEVGFYAPAEGAEYGNGVYFHVMETYEVAAYVGDEALVRARRAVHYLNGGTL